MRPAPTRPRARAARGCAARARAPRSSPSPTASSICGRRSRTDSPPISVAQLRQQVGNLARQHRARGHVGDVARLPLVEADEHAALLHDVPHREPRAMPVFPRRPVDRAAAAAPARTRPRRHSASSSVRCFAATCAAASKCCCEQPPQTPKCGQRGSTRAALDLSTASARARSNVGFFFSVVIATDLARQRALDEDRLAVDARDAAPLLVERGDRRDRRGAGDGGIRRRWAGADMDGDDGRRDCNRARSRRRPRRRRPGRVEFGRCESWRSTHRPSGAASPSATARAGTGWTSMPDSRTRSACCRWCAPCSPTPDGRSRVSTASRSAPAPARSPACASAAASRRDSRLAPTCRSCRFPRSRRSRRKSFAPAAGATCSRVSMRGCARSTSPPMRAPTTGGGNGRAVGRCRRPRRRARSCRADDGSGSAPAMASPRIRRSRRSLRSRRRRRRCAPDGAVDRRARAAAARRRRGRALPPTRRRSTCATAWR